MPVRQIERISMPDDDTFFREYVFTRKPAIITNLFSQDEIGQCRARSDAEAAFKDVRLRIQPEYTAKASGSDQAERVMTFEEYWAFTNTDPSTPMMCTEYEIPAKIMASFTLPHVCRARDLRDEEVFALPRRCGDNDLMANLFVGNRGNKAHLHYDGDHRHVLLNQVFGRKQVILFQPASGLALLPTDAAPGRAGMCLEQMSETEKREFVDAADGYLDTLYPGETIYIPMLMWHYLEYLDDAMSFNLRFGRNPFGRFLCVDNFHRDYYVQNFSAHLCDRSKESRFIESITRVSDQYVQPAASKRDKVQEMRALFKELCAQVCPEAKVEEYCPREREEGELLKVMKEVHGSLRYEAPDAIARTRLVGPISATQRRQLEQEVSKRAYPESRLSRILDNRLGKQRLDDLTRAEAAQFMSYLSTPASSW
jgi:lysine-specific demethylase 8